MAWVPASGIFPKGTISMSNLRDGFNLQPGTTKITNPFNLSNFVGRSLYNAGGTSYVVPPLPLSMSYFNGLIFLKNSPITIIYYTTGVLSPPLNTTPSKYDITIVGGCGGGGGGGGSLPSGFIGGGGGGGTGLITTFTNLTYNSLNPIKCLTIGAPGLGGGGGAGTDNNGNGGGGSGSDGTSGGNTVVDYAGNGTTQTVTGGNAGKGGTVSSGGAGGSSVGDGSIAGSVGTGPYGSGSGLGGFGGINKFLMVGGFGGQSGGVVNTSGTPGTNGSPGQVLITWYFT